MKIFLTNSPFRWYFTTCFNHPDWGALNLAQLAAMVPEHEIKILDNWSANWKLWGFNKILKNMERFCPDVVGISNSTDGDTESVAETARQIRKKFPNIILLTGGQSATVNYEYLLKYFDFVIMGEGEYTFKELIEKLDKGESCDIKGLAYLKDSRVVITEPRPFANLDDLPSPARKYQPRLKSIYFPGRYSSEIETSRGCPYGCEYCSITAFYKRTWRKKSNEKIMAEFREIKKLGASQVYFIDDSFGINAKEYTQLLQSMISEKLDIKWYTQIRADVIANNPQMIELAAKSGMFCAMVGFESYSDNVLKEVGKVSSREINFRCSEILRKNKIVVWGAHIFGLPGQTEKDHREIYKYGRKNSDIFRLSIFSPIPGTPAFEKYGVKLYKERQYVHAYGVQGINRMKFFLYVFRYTFSPFTFFGLFMGNKISRRIKLQSYLTNFRYGIYFILRKLGIKIL